VRWLVVALVAGCVHDSYLCSSDADCNIGTAPRCEVDQRCTAIDESCATKRRYSDDAGNLAGACYTGTVIISDVCAAGQPPAVADGCAATVCDALSACCTTGWSEACVQQAQRACGIACDTRIAITATSASTTELWELRYDTAWHAKRHDELREVIAYLAPAPGGTKPRLVGITPSPKSLLVDGTNAIPLEDGHAYLDVTPVDFDRDLRDTAVLSWQDNGAPPATSLEVLKLDSRTSREVQSQGAVRLAWGDYDHDSYPDAAAGQFNRPASAQRYFFLASIFDDDHASVVDDSTNAAFGNGVNGVPALRSFDWIDVNGDGVLDLVAWGNSVRVHLGGERVENAPSFNFDCDPPTAPMAAMCPNMDMPAADVVSLAGAAVTVDKGAALVIGTDQKRELFRLTNVGIGMVQREQLVVPQCATQPCSPILAVVARDLDGDGVLDLIAIDADLQVFAVMSKTDPTLTTLVQVMQLGSTTGFTAVRTSVSGAQR
jgi:hypothetical protein